MLDAFNKPHRRPHLLDDLGQRARHRSSCFYDGPTPQNSWTASPRLRKPNPSCQNSLGLPGALATFRCAFPGGRKHSPGPLPSAADAGTVSTAANVKPAIVLCMSYLLEVASNADDRAAQDRSQVAPLLSPEPDNPRRLWAGVPRPAFALPPSAGAASGGLALGALLHVV